MNKLKNMSVEEYLKMRNKGMPNIAIAENKGVSEATLYNWIKKNKSEIEGDRMENKIEGTRDYQKELEKFKSAITDRQDQIEKLKDENKQKDEEILRLTNLSSEYKKQMERVDSDSFEEKYEREKEAHQKLFDYLRVIMK